MSPSNVTGKHRGRGIYLLPNLFTTSALFAGFYSMIASIGGRYETAAIAILVAMVLDGFDGRVARMTNTTTAFGAEYDSMADMVSFGAAPALLMYTWSLNSLSLEQYGADKRFFQGLACPAAAACLASLVWVAEEAHVAGADIVWLVALVTVIGGLLMVSSFTYYSFKDLGDSKKVPFAMLIGLLLLFVTTAVDPPKMILIASMTYGISGPAYTLLRRLRKRNRLPRNPS